MYPIDIWYEIASHLTTFYQITFSMVCKETYKVCRKNHIVSLVKALKCTKTINRHYYDKWFDEYYIEDGKLWKRVYDNGRYSSATRISIPFNEQPLRVSSSNYFVILTKDDIFIRPTRSHKYLKLSTLPNNVYDVFCMGDYIYLLSNDGPYCGYLDSGYTTNYPNKFYFHKMMFDKQVLKIIHIPYTNNNLFWTTDGLYVERYNSFVTLIQDDIINVTLMGGIPLITTKNDAFMLSNELHYLLY